MTDRSASFSQGTAIEYDALLATDFPTVTRKGTIKTGEGILPRGTLLGKITSGGLLVKSLSDSSDGSQTPYGILVDDVDATSAAADGMVYVTGHFRSSEMTFGASHTAASVQAGLRGLGIHID